jgi:4-aminobutyrate--pyruvate transaminase
VGGIEFVADKKARRQFDPKAAVGAYCVTECQKLGLITRTIGDTVALCPPMVVTEDEIHEMFDIVEAAVKSTETWVRKEGLQ